MKSVAIMNIAIKYAITIRAATTNYMNTFEFDLTEFLGYFEIALFFTICLVTSESSILISLSSKSISSF